MIGSDRFISSFGALPAPAMTEEDLAKAIRLGTANGFTMALTDDVGVPLCTERVAKKRAETHSCRDHVFVGTPGKATPTLASARVAMRAASGGGHGFLCVSVDLETSGYVVVVGGERRPELPTIERRGVPEWWYELPEGVALPSAWSIAGPDTEYHLRGLRVMPPSRGGGAPRVVGQPAPATPAVLKAIGV